MFLENAYSNSKNNSKSPTTYLSKSQISSRSLSHLRKKFRKQSQSEEICSQKLASANNALKILCVSNSEPNNQRNWNESEGSLKIEYKSESGDFTKVTKSGKNSPHVSTSKNVINNFESSCDTRMDWDIKETLELRNKLSSCSGKSSYSKQKEISVRLAEQKGVKKVLSVQSKDRRSSSKEKLQKSNFNPGLVQHLLGDFNLSRLSSREFDLNNKCDQRTATNLNTENCDSHEVFHQKKTHTINDRFSSKQNFEVPDLPQKKSIESIISNVSKRSNSAPPTNNQRRYKNPRDIQFSAHNRSRINETGSKCGLIIDSIKKMVFPEFENRTLDEKEPNSWDDQEEHEFNENNVKFPKETKTAVMIMMYNSNVTKTKHASEKERCQEQNQEKRTLKEAEVQTPPRDSCVKTKKRIIVKEPLNVPCTKNLLCKKGKHSGKCAKLPPSLKFSNCSDDCVCRNKNYWCPECETLWSGPPHLCPKNKLIFTNLLRDPKQSPNILQLNRKRTLPEATMNGMNGHTNGELNGCDIITQNQQKGCWTIGLINSKFRYLTAETFGFKINANGSSLKKKQIWTLEPDHGNGSESYIYLRSHLDKYLAVDSFGNVTCEGDEKEPGSKFQISVAEDGTGRWAFRNVVRGYFLGSSSDKLTCTAKVPGDAEFWHVHLAARPQVNLRSIGRKRFAHLSENLDEIHVDANIPWGEDTLFTLEFRADESGKYALHTCNNKYLSSGGKLVDSCNKDCLFTAEYHSGQLALRDRNGAYLSPIGSKAVLKTRSNTVTKDELFSLEDSLPQASFVAALNSRYVSVKQGVDVTANQDEISDYETFQLEFDWSTKRWYIRTMQDRYWTLETGGGIQAVGDKRSSNALFDLIWQGDGSVAFRANNGRYVITKRSGHLYATADSIDENCKYFFYLINRPILVLKSEQGFVGFKSSSSPKLECNKATYETIQVERAEKGVIYFKGQNGKYWHCDTEGVTADSDVPEGFYLELREPTRLSIKSVTGSYLTASKNGTFRLGESSFETATQWEY